VVQPQLRSIGTHAGRSIVATFFRPEARIRASVLIAPAMGVSQGFYAPVAAWLASEGFLVATFDYLGMGLSRPAKLRGLRVSITDWATFDCEAMIHAIQHESGGRPLYWVGHSLGGQIPGLVPSRERIFKLVTIACGSGYWRDNPLALRRRVWWLWYVAAPIATRIFGYFPGKRLRKVGDLPRGVMEQWRRWCLNPHYAVGVEGAAIEAQYASLRTPITSFSFSDDEFMSLQNTESLHRCYAGAPRTMKRIAPMDVGAERIGHFGFFKTRFRESLWKAHLLPELV